MKEKVIILIVGVLKDLNKTIQNPDLENPTPQTDLHGPKGNLDSLALINLVVKLEESIYIEFQKTVVIANETTMDFSTSVFGTVETLADHIERLLETG
ncbi:MAG: hypothetical protein WC975_12460 [Phycisphaerae bacterium]